MTIELVINPPQSIFDQAITLAAQTHGWGHQSYEYKFFKEAFDKYWFICMVDKSEGLYYCRDEYRGKGYGKPVFKEMMDIVGGANCVLMAASDMSQKYADGFGFKEMSPYWHLKAIAIPGKMRIPELSGEYSTKNWQDVDMDQLNAYDSTICPLNRKMRNQLWFQQDKVYTKIAFDFSQNIVGYCSIRVVNLNRLLADPFYAENEEVAARLLADVVNEIPKFEKFEKLIFRCPEVNKGMEGLMTRFFPPDGYEAKVRTRVQFTKKLLKSRDEVVYSAGCPTHQFV